MRLLSILIAFTALPVFAWAEIVVFAAASLKRPLDEIAAQYDGEVIVSYGGSGTMAQQIYRGAPADVYLSANTEWIDWIASRVDGLDITQFASNQLVVVGRGPRLTELSDLATVSGHIAVGHMRSVPAGIYARAALEAVGVRDAVSDRLIEVPSVTAAHRLVLLGEADSGIVYLTDALAHPELPVQLMVPSTLHPDISYSAVLLSPEGEDFFSYLQGQEARAVLISYGFGP